MIPRMKAHVRTLSKVHDELALEWNGRTYLTTGPRGSFTPEKIREHKRRFAGVPKAKKK